jgi:MFS family permease
LLVGRFISGLSAGIFTGTATATLLDLAPEGGRGRATLVGTMANMTGLGAGPLLAGVLSQLFVSPLRLSFWAHLAVLVPAAIGVWAMPEPGSPSQRPKFRAQTLTVPPNLRAAFIRASLAGFAGFAVLGLFTAVSPAFLSLQLGVKSRAVIGLVVFAVFLASAAGQLALERISERVALQLGCAKLIAGMGVLAVGLAVSSLALLVIGGVAAGFGQGLSFRAALAGLNAGSPPAQRAEVASSFFVVAYVAISLPVIGVGVLAQSTSLRTAGLIFAGVVAALAAAALVLLLRRGEE